jgi:hypothetical protein
MMAAASASILFCLPRLSWQPRPAEAACGLDLGVYPALREGALPELASGQPLVRRHKWPIRISAAASIPSPCHELANLTSELTPRKPAWRPFNAGAKARHDRSFMTWPSGHAGTV